MKNVKELRNELVSLYQTTDGFDHGHDWICKHDKKDKVIQGFVEWHEERKVKIPDWCPIKVKN